MTHSRNFFVRPALDADSRRELLGMLEAAFTPDVQRHARLVQLSPRDAVRTWMLYDFGPLDEPALCFAIRRDPEIALDDDGIADEIAAFVDSVSTEDEPLEPHDPDLDDLVGDMLSFLRMATREAAKRDRRRR